MMFDTLAAEVHEINRAHGFYDEDRGLATHGERLMLIVSEVAEIMEALRREDTEHEAEELADVVIRVLDYAAYRGISLDKEVRTKIEKNRARPYKHGKAF